MTQATRQAFIASQTIAVEHIRISSERSFAEVRRKAPGAAGYCGSSGCRTRLFAFAPNIAPNRIIGR
jgi:hypothetical protein